MTSNHTTYTETIFNDIKLFDAIITPFIGSMVFYSCYVSSQNITTPRNQQINLEI